MLTGGTGGTAGFYNNVRGVAYKELTVSAVQLLQVLKFH